MNTQNEKILLETSNILLQIGIPGNVVGSKYLLRAVTLAINDPSAISGITKTIYPLIAMEFGSKVSNIERGIRHAIEIAFNKGKITQLNHIFGVNIYGKNEKPANSEFITLLATRIPFLLKNK